MFNIGDKVWFLGPAWEVEAGTIQRILNCACIGNGLPVVFVVSSIYGDIPIVETHLFVDEYTASNRSEAMLQLAIERKESGIFGICDAMAMLSNPLEPLNIAVEKAVMKKSKFLGWEK